MASSDEDFTELHRKALRRICRRCGNAHPPHKLRSISDRIRDSYSQNWGEDLKLDDPNFMPSVICNTCRINLDMLMTGNTISEKSLSSSPACFDKQLNLRNTVFCNSEAPCLLCQKMEHFTTDSIVSRRKISKEKSAGRKPLHGDDSTFEINCGSCFKPLCVTERESPARHKCSSLKNKVVHQVMSAIENSKISESDVLSATVSRSMNDDEDQPSTSGVLVCLPNITGIGGPPKKVLITSPNQVSDAKRVLPLRSLIGLKSISSSVSNNTLKRLNICTGSRFSGVKFPHIKRMYSDRNVSIGRFFASETLLLEESKKLISKQVIICNDIADLILNWISSTDEDENGISVKISVDHGQGFLKVGVQVIDKPEFSNSVSDFLLLCVAEVSESRHNLLSLLSLPQFVRFFENGRFTILISADLKCLQLMAGISTGNAKFPCVLCDWKSGDGYDSERKLTLRTGDNHKENLRRFMTEFSSNLARASECYNCIDESYFDGQAPNMYKCAIPILHMTLGIVQHLYQSMTESLTQDEEQEVEAVLKQIGVERQPYHGNAFDGRSSHAILNNLEKFPVCVSRTSAYNALKYYSRFLSLCGGVHRREGWLESITDFQIAFQETGLKPFLKVHMISHVQEYFAILDSFCTFEHPGLAWTGEQAIESSHHHFKEVWERFKTCPKTKNSLLLAVTDFNYVRYLTGFSD